MRFDPRDDRSLAASELRPAIDAATAVLERSNSVMAATLVEVFSHPDVARYLATATDPEDGSLSGPTPYAAVLLPLLYGPHAGRNLRFFPMEAVEERAYARAVTTAQALYAADQRMGARDTGALDWIVRCIAETGSFESYDRLLDAQYARHALGLEIAGHNSLENLSGPWAFHAPLLAKLYNGVLRPAADARDHYQRAA